VSASQRLSVVIPLYNEQQSLPPLLEELGVVLGDIPGGPHEIVAVDDGSTDATLTTLEAAARLDARLVIISLSRNFGHQAAICAGLDHATGDLVVVMDGDGQDPPGAIHRLLAKHELGYDVVYAQRVARKEGGLLRASYYLFYRAVAALSETPLPLDAGDFALLTRRVVEAIRSAPERQRYLRGLRTWVGFRQAGIPVERAERVAGTSKYDARALLRLAFDGIFAFSVVPLRAAAILGVGAMLLSFLFAGYSLLAKLFHDESPRGFTALIMAIVFLSGVQLFFLGIIGEYVGRVYEETKARPLYLVSRIVRGGQ
jgi:glycosyltransferase involved in cell wall biosynthesis